MTFDRSDTIARLRLVRAARREFLGLWALKHCGLGDPALSLSRAIREADGVTASSAVPSSPSNRVAEHFASDLPATGVDRVERRGILDD